MNDPTFLQVQSLELQRLLEQANDDPILVPQLRQRLESVTKKLNQSRQRPGDLFPAEQRFLPCAAVFLNGGGVEPEGVSPALAGDVLIQYEKMFVEQAIHDEREAAKKSGRKRRPRGAPTPRLCLSGTPRGSFGFEFVPQVADEDPELLEVHAKSFENVANAIFDVAQSGNESLETSVKNIPQRVLPHLKMFLKSLAQRGTEIRLAFHDRPSRTLKASDIVHAAERLEREMSEDIVDRKGVFRGIALESGVFDLKLEDDEVITGAVADALSEDDLNHLVSLINRPCIVKLQQTIFSQVTAPAKITYMLLEGQLAE